MRTPSAGLPSDKVTWHRYVDFYEPHLARLRKPRNVLEFGVWRGASIRYLRERYPNAAIVGCDILVAQPEWPRDARIEYVTVDQADVEGLRDLFLDHPPFDLIIEDGSHQPEHQRNCLITGLRHIRPGGIYILEDLQTSHPSHPMSGGAKRLNCYHLLLAVEHVLSTGIAFSDSLVNRLSSGSSLFSSAEVRDVFARVSQVDLYRRATLPLRCYKCGSVDFDYGALRCTCGVELAATADSMSAVITVR